MAVAQDWSLVLDPWKCEKRQLFTKSWDRSWLFYVVFYVRCTCFDLNMSQMSQELGPCVTCMQTNFSKFTEKLDHIIHVIYEHYLLSISSTKKKLSSGTIGGFVWISTSKIDAAAIFQNYLALMSLKSFILFFYFDKNFIVLC